MPSYENETLTTDAFYEALLDDNVEDLYENAPCGYLSTAPDGTIVKVNQTFLTWTGLDRHLLLGRKRFSELLAPGGRIFYETHIAPMLRMQDRVREIAVEIVCEDGARLPVLVNGVMKRSHDGTPQMVRIAVFDATERRAYEQELLRARQRAEDSEARANTLARTLQAAFIPPAPPEIPGLDVAARYRPAGDGTEIGGDFYDLFKTGDDEWGVVLGDVCGKGVEAAALTALARHASRAAADRDALPSQVLTSLNRAILRDDIDRFCTALYLRIGSASDSGRQLTLCSGGHLLPLVVDANGAVTAVGASGTLLGVYADVVLEDASVTLTPGSAIVLFTDGVSEARSEEGDFFGETRLREALSASGDATADEIADHVLDAVLGFQHGMARDDIAIVVVKNPRQ